MEQENKIPLEDNEMAGEIKKNKGGRPKGKPDCSTSKVTLYLTEEEHALLTEFAKTAWYTFNYSGAVRHLVLMGLKEWTKKGRKTLVK